MVYSGYSTNKTDRHDTEILLKVALNTIAIAITLMLDHIVF